MKKKILSLLTTICLVFIVFVLIKWLSDKPFSFPSNKKNKIGAIAIRDNVIPFQKLGSRLFTIPYLSAKYINYTYFTQYYKEDKREAFKDSLYSYLNKYDSVDIYLLAHTNYYYTWLDTFPRNKLKKIRMVYNTGCGNANQANIWLSMGVSSYIGHTGIKSQSPVFYFFFLRRLLVSNNIKNSVDKANQMTESFFSIYSFLDSQPGRKEMVEGSKATYYTDLYEFDK